MFSPSRLTLARQKRGLSKKELAGLLNLTPQSISNFESEIVKEEPSTSTLLNIAKVLDFPVNFFSRKRVEPIDLESASFRALTKMPASQRDSSLATGLLAFELNEWIENKFTLPVHNLTDLRNETPESAAILLRQMWNLGERPISNMIHLLESKGIRVYFIAEDYKNVDAFSVWKNGTPFILLNNLKSAERSRFDAAHELGHLVLHKHGITQKNKEAEKEANNFASAFLMPEATIISQAPALPTLTNLIKLKKYWQVSLAALVYRLNRLNLITEWQYRTLNIEISKKGYNINEPDSITRETSQVLDKVFNNLSLEQISKADVALELGLSVKELQKLILGIAEIQGGNKGNSQPSKANLRIIK